MDPRVGQRRSHSPRPPGKGSRRFFLLAAAAALLFADCPWLQRQFGHSPQQLYFALRPSPCFLGMSGSNSPVASPSCGPRPPKAVLWDVDGTLVDSTPMSFACTNEVLRRGGYAEISEADYKLGTRYTTPLRMASHVGCEDLTDPVGERLAQEFDELYVDMVTPTTCPTFDGISPLLRNFLERGSMMGALSNACGTYVRKVLSVHGFASDFRVQLGADEVPDAKPAPDGLLQCCEALGCSPADCVYVGDAPTDGQAAKAAGMHSIGVAWGSHVLKAADFTLIVGSVEDLENALYTVGVSASAAKAGPVPAAADGS